MSRTPMQTFNLLLMTIGITMGILIAVTLIVLIWLGTASFGETGARLVGSAAVVCWVPLSHLLAWRTWRHQDQQ